MQVVLKSHTFDFYRNSCPPMNGCYRMQTFEQLQRVRLVPRTAQAGKGVLFISSEIEEMLRTCNRLAVLRDGAKVGELSGDMTQEKVMKTIAEG